MKDTLRWVAVPFAALAGLFIVFVIARFLTWINLFGYMAYTGEGVSAFSLTGIIIELFVQAASGYGFVLFGTYVAPSYKRIVSIILATIFCCIIAVSLCLAAFKGTTFWQIISILSGAVGAIYASYSTTKDETA